MLTSDLLINLLVYENRQWREATCYLLGRFDNSWLFEFPPFNSAHHSTSLKYSLWKDISKRLMK
jgi:hypothetical protein